MASRKPVLQKQPSLPPERALRAITAQLAELEKLKGRRYDEADGDERKWDHQTQSLIEAAYGDPSSELTRFHRARTAGTHSMMGIPPHQRQQNFERRIIEQSALLESLVATLRLQLPEEEIQGVYEPGDDYSFYRDLSSLVQAATKDILIVDAYLDENLFNLYVSKIPDPVPVRILSNKVDNNVETVAGMYAKRRAVGLRSSADIHDRAVFIDQRGWVIGQSIKDAAKKKPTYLIELSEPQLATSREAHERIWAAAAVIV